MTLLTTELHPVPGRAVIVFAADRRVTRGTSRSSDQKKVMWVPSIRVGIGFFGLAEVPTSAGRQPMTDWLQDFLYTVRPDETVAVFAHRLAGALNAAVPVDWRNEASGFHVAGFGAEGSPEFWFVRNVDDSRQPSLGRYEAREDFHRRDRHTLPVGAHQIYRNGDIRAHITAWERLDKAFGTLLTQPDFRPIVTTRDYVDWVQFKLEMVADFYERYCSESIIGRPIDSFAFSPSEYEASTMVV